MSDIQKLRAAFQGIVDIGRKVDCPFKIETNLAAPPAYMVKLALVVIGNYRWFGPDTDPSWSIYLNYKGANFAIHSDGQAMWAIDADRDSADAKATAQDIRKKIIAVAANLDKVLAQDLNQIVVKGEFTLNNPYPKIRHAYEWFRDKSRSSETEMYAWERMEQNGSSPAREALPERSLHGYTMMGYYFSLIETLCNVFYAFGERSIDFTTFRTRSWQERLQTVLPVRQHPELQRIFNTLVMLRVNFHAEMFHGFGGDEQLHVDLPGLGVVPIAHEALTQSVYFSPLLADTAFVDIALQTFDACDTWLKQNMPWSHWVLYAESGLEIPFYGRRMEQIKRAMAYPEDFHEWLTKEVLYRHYLEGKSVANGQVGIGRPLSH
jgi:hypothetical protein